ncbi:MAG: rhodanese-like domain-containing protein [Armatimonadetes bacterium]|nr:rhodanese-like domain-containing protein [Armatimonadota bacterium]
MKKRWMLLVAIIAAFSVLFFTGCKDDTTDPGTDEFELLVQYMADNDLDLPTMLAGGEIVETTGTYSWVVSATAVFDYGIENIFIMDIRKGDKYGPDSTGVWPVTPTPNEITDYDDGHIEGAHSVALADVVTYEAANNIDDLPVLVACYSGHDTGHAVMALRLNGETQAQSLKWGMSSWNADFDLWQNFIGNAANDYPGCWDDDDVVPALPEYTEAPILETGMDAGVEILEYQINNAILDGLNGITIADVLSDYEAYDIYNYWGVADWEYYGHITTSYQVTPGELGLETLDILNPNGTNVVYCWSGQNASMIAAWLNVLGYDGRVLKFSANGMIYDLLEAGKWIGSEDYDYVTP